MNYPAERMERLEQKLVEEIRRREAAEERVRALEAVEIAVEDWLKREWKALSKAPTRDGQRAASLTILEADLDAARRREG